MIDTPEDIEAKLINRNRQHFGQASSTFPTIPPFAKWIDWSASSNTAELILDGSFTSSKLSSLTNDLLQHLKTRTELDLIPATLTKNKWMTKIISWLEQTTTSPSGYCVGHSKVLTAEHDIDPDSPKIQLLENK